MVKIYVEGGGDVQDLKDRCRKAFLDLLSQDDVISGRKPKIIACGGRTKAFDAFKIALKRNENAFLLVDSEKPVPDKFLGRPWDFLRSCEQWKGLNDRCDDETCHLMVQAMEAWLLSDEKALSEYYGNGFKSAIPKTSTIETWSKDSMSDFLSKSISSCKTRNNKKREYDKGRDSFIILSKVNLQALCARSKWAKRFVDCVRTESMKG